MGFIEITEQMGALLQKNRQVALDHAPDELIVDGYILVGELVSKTDDLWCLINLSKQVFISP
nr:hypothetical protein [Synechococcus sp. 1G10]